MEATPPTEEQNGSGPPFPDLRQTLCHTLLAAAFALLWVFNPLSGENAEEKIHLWVMVFIVGFAVTSSVVVLRTWSVWRRLPAQLRALQVRAAALDKNRAKSHGLMSALSLLLTGFVFLARAFLPELTTGPVNRILFGAAMGVAMLSAAVLTRVVRDLLLQGKQ